jgi:hypothetical protein
MLKVESIPYLSRDHTSCHNGDHHIHIYIPEVHSYPLACGHYSGKIVPLNLVPVNTKGQDTVFLIPRTANLGSE